MGGGGGVGEGGGGGVGDSGGELVVGTGGGGGGGRTRKPQSAQSVPYTQSENSAPGPPSSQLPSRAFWHVFAHPGEAANGA